MSLDDRLRGAYQRHYDDVRRRVDEGRLDTTERPRERRAILAPRIAVLAAVAAVAIGSALLFSSLVDADGAGIETGPAAGDGGQTTSVIEAEPTTTTAPPTTTLVSEPTEPPTPEPPATNTTPTTIDPPSSELPADQPLPGPSRPSDVCPSGFRAPLEQAVTSYVGPNQGWGRKDDLIDEQDGPNRFEAWEPGYPDEVVVEVALADPVIATDIRVAQDPFTPVDGVITIRVEGAAAQPIELLLSGTEGWRVHTFDEPLVVTRFTIGREQAESNIMEVLVCVEAPG